VADIQEKLCNYIPGQSKTIDSGHLLWLGYSVWQSDRQTNNFNHIDITTKLVVERGVESGNMLKLVDDLLLCNQIRSSIIHNIMYAESHSVTQLKHRTVGKVSYLMKKDVNNMKSFSWDNVFVEACETMPDLVRILLAIMMKWHTISHFDVENMKKVIPKIGMIFSILVNHANPELNLSQRVLSTVLHDSNCQRIVSIALNVLMYAFK
jgi:hypothetical protein